MITNTGRLWNGFKARLALCKIPLSWFQTVTAWLNGMQIEGGRIERTPQGIKIYPGTDGWQPGESAESFRPKVLADGSGITMQTGDVVLGPGTWIEWGSITGATTAPAVSDSDTHVWLEINVSAPSAAMVVGSKAEMMAACTSSKTTIAYPLIETTWSGVVCVAAKRLLDAIIPRAAG